MVKGALVFHCARFLVCAVSCHRFANLVVLSSRAAQSRFAMVVSAQGKEVAGLNLRAQLRRLRKKSQNQLLWSYASYPADQLARSYVMISRGKGTYPAPRCRICSRSSRAVNKLLDQSIMFQDSFTHTGSHCGGTASR